MNINEEIQASSSVVTEGRNPLPKKRISKKKIPKEEITEVLEEKVAEVIETVEDPEIIRKKEIADKRRKTLEIARSKIKSKTQIKQENTEVINNLKKEKEEEMMRIKEENEKLKAIAEEKPKIKIVKKYVNAPIPIKKKKSPRSEPQTQPITQPAIPQAQPTTDYLVQQTYAEQLQKRMRETILNRVMMDTFG